MPRKKKEEFKVGDIVAIEFFDHVKRSGHSTGQMRFIVYGRIYELDEVHTEIDCWCHADTDMNVFDRENPDHYSIINSTIIRVDKLKVEKSFEVK